MKPAGREFIRHPTDIPAYLVLDEEKRQVDANLLNLSFGGVALVSEFEMEKGQVVHINIATVRPVYHGCGVVVWCQKIPGDLFEIGVCFDEKDEAFQSRMVEQVCQIQHYKNNREKELGREIDIEQAAAEWIKTCAAEFNQSEK